MIKNLSKIDYFNPQNKYIFTTSYSEYFGIKFGSKIILLKYSEKII